MPADGRPLVVLAALREEAAALVAPLTRSAVSSPGLTAWDGLIGGTPVAVLLTGVGKVAAAMAAQFACDELSPRCLVSIGLAGGVESESEPGRLIIASAALQHDMDARPLTAARGIVPGREEAMFAADGKLCAGLMRAAEGIVEDARIVRSGLVLTGDQIVTSREVRDRLIAAFPEGACFDMETAAIAQVSIANGVPWGGVRVTSDSADENFNLDAVLGFGASTAAELFDRIIRELVKGLMK